MPFRKEGHIVKHYKKIIVCSSFILYTWFLVDLIDSEDL